MLFPSAPRVVLGEPAALGLVEPAHHSLHVPPALDFELGVEADARAADRMMADVGADDIDLPARPFRALFGDQHRHRIGFLPRRHAALPDRQPAAQLVDLATSFQRGSSRSEEHTSELQSLMRISYAVFCLKKKTTTNNQ